MHAGEEAYEMVEDGLIDVDEIPALRLRVVAVAGLRNPFIGSTTRHI
jgi:hypothetical protein